MGRHHSAARAGSLSRGGLRPQHRPREPPRVADHRRAVSHGRHQAGPVHGSDQGIPDRLRSGRLGCGSPDRQGAGTLPRQWLAGHVSLRVAEETFDRGRLADKVPALMTVARRGYDFVAEIAPDGSDVLLPKKHPSAFFGTPLASYLIERAVDTLVVTGCTTSGCVRGSVVDAFAYNFRVLVPHDAVYDRSQVSHAVNLFDMSEKYADVMSTDEALAALKSVKRAAA